MRGTLRVHNYTLGTFFSQLVLWQANRQLWFFGVHQLNAALKRCVVTFKFTGFFLFITVQTIANSIIFFAFSADNQEGKKECGGHWGYILCRKQKKEAKSHRQVRWNKFGIEISVKESKNQDRRCASEAQTGTTVRPVVKIRKLWQTIVNDLPGARAPADPRDQCKHTKCSQNPLLASTALE